MYQHVLMHCLTLTLAIVWVIVCDKERSHRHDRYRSPSTFNKCSSHLFQRLITNVLTVELENFTKMKHSKNKFEVPTLESWLCEYNSRHNKERAAESKGASIFWKYPEFFENRKDLPPSLRKFEERDFKDSNFEEWGIWNCDVGYFEV